MRCSAFKAPKYLLRSSFGWNDIRLSYCTKTQLILINKKKEQSLTQIGWDTHAFRKNSTLCSCWFAHLSQMICGFVKIPIVLFRLDEFGFFYKYSVRTWIDGNWAKCNGRLSKNALFWFVKSNVFMCSHTMNYCYYYWRIASTPAYNIYLISALSRAHIFPRCLLVQMTVRFWFTIVVRLFDIRY